MIELENQTPHTPDMNLLKKVADQLTDAPVELILTDDETVRDLNRRHRGKDSPTDVLSFPLAPVPHAPLGSVVISLDRASAEAKRLGHTIDEEIALLFLHGLLHLLGYDHETDDGQMRQKEREIIEALRLPPSLIIRTEGEDRG